MNTVYKFNTELFYKYYNELLDPISSVLEPFEQNFYMKCYLTDAITILSNDTNFVIFLEPRAEFNNIEDRFFKFTIKQVIYDKENIINPMEIILNKYSILNDLFILEKIESNNFIYKFKISSYKSLKVFDTLIKLMKRRDS